MENRNELNQIVNLLGELMVQLDTQNKQVLDRFDRLETTLVSLTNGINAFVDMHRITTQAHEERIRRLEEFVFRKGA